VEKVSNLVREIVAGIISRDVQMPAGALVTVTRVEASDDLYSARVYVSVFAADPAVEKTVIKELSRATGKVQHQLNRQLRMRPVPRISFAIDENEKRRERIEKLLSDND
jgi:ribosome-binding factor A